jgi:hypothetical protein
MGQSLSFEHRMKQAPAAVVVPPRSLQLEVNQSSRSSSDEPPAPQPDMKANTSVPALAMILLTITTPEGPDLSAGAFVTESTRCHRVSVKWRDGKTHALQLKK